MSTGSRDRLSANHSSPDGADGELPRPHLLHLDGVAGAGAGRQQRVHLHLGVVVVRVVRARVDEASTEKIVRLEW